MVNETSAGILIYNKNQEKYLILHYTSGHYDFAKGHIEEKETEKKAALRELEEETGIKEEEIELIESFKEQITYNFNRRDDVVKKNVVFFLALTYKNKIILSHEHKGFLWLSYNEAHKRLTYENAKGLLKKAHLTISKA